jgi:CheY-like chemotaxis protein
MSGALSRTDFSPLRRPKRRRPTLGDREQRRPDRPDRGGRREPRPAGRLPESESSAPRAPTGGKAAVTGKVLIVDDEQAIRLICRVNLGSAGFETLEAADGAEALALARSERPDLILLDIMLPTLDGWSVAEELAAGEATRDIPVLFLSARSEHADLRRGYELGGVGYITKPFDAAELPEVVARALEAVRSSQREALRRAWHDELGDD